MTDLFLTGFLLAGCPVGVGRLRPQSPLMLSLILENLGLGIKVSFFLFRSPENVNVQLFLFVVINFFQLPADGDFRLVRRATHACAISLKSESTTASVRCCPEILSINHVFAKRGNCY